MSAIRDLERTIAQMAGRIAGLDHSVENLQALEFGTGVDPAWAGVKTFGYLQSQMGQRWIGWNQNANMAIGSPVPSITFNNFTDAVDYDSVRHYNYLTLQQSATEYMYHDATTSPGWGIWGLDAGALVWPVNDRVGITAGAWFKPASLPTQEMGIISAWNANTTNASWRMLVDTVTNPDKLRCSISNTGSFVTGQEVLSSVNVPTGRWLFGVMRFNPSTEIKLWLFDGDSVDIQTNTTSIVSDAFDAKYLYVGNYRRSTGTDDSFNGEIGFSFFYVSRWTDADVDYLFQTSRHIYGV